MWSPVPRNNGLNVTYYRVFVYKGSLRVQNETIPAEDTQTHFRLDELESGILYTVEVAASNVAGFGRSVNTSFITNQISTCEPHVYCLMAMMLNVACTVNVVQSHETIYLILIL